MKTLTDAEKSALAGLNEKTVRVYLALRDALLQSPNDLDFAIFGSKGQRKLDIGSSRFQSNQTFAFHCANCIHKIVAACYPGHKSLLGEMSKENLYLCITQIINGHDVSPKVEGGAA